MSTKGNVMGIGTYAELINQRIVGPDTQTNYMKVDSHFFINCMLPILQKIRVDEAWYLRAYPDVQAAIQKGVVADPKSHYCRFGFYEHRMPYHIVVDEPWYLTEYPDVRTAIAGRHFASGQAHFDLLGFREGRFPYANFRLDLIDGVKLNGQGHQTTRVRMSSKASNGTIHVGSTPY